MYRNNAQPPASGYHYGEPRHATAPASYRRFRAPPYPAPAAQAPNYSNSSYPTQASGYYNAPQNQSHTSYGYSHAMPHYSGQQSASFFHAPGLQQYPLCWMNSNPQPPANYGRQSYVAYPGNQSNSWANGYSGSWGSQTYLPYSSQPSAPSSSVGSYPSTAFSGQENYAPSTSAPPPGKTFNSQLHFPPVPPGFRAFYYEMDESYGPNAAHVLQSLELPPQSPAQTQRQEHETSPPQDPAEGPSMVSQKDARTDAPKQHMPGQELRMEPGSPKIQAHSNGSLQVLSVHGGWAKQPPIPLAARDRDEAAWAKTWKWWSSDAIAMDGWRKLCWRQVSYGTTAGTGILVGGPLELTWMSYGSTARIPAANLSPTLINAALRRYKELYSGVTPPVFQHTQPRYTPIYKYHYVLGSPSKGPVMWLY